MGFKCKRCFVLFSRSDFSRVSSKRLLYFTVGTPCQAWVVSKVIQENNCDVVLLLEFGTNDRTNKTTVATRTNSQIIFFVY